MDNLNSITKSTVSRILLTGISGFVGTAVAHDLLAHGYKVRGLDQSPLNDDTLKARAKETPGDLEMVYASMTDRLALLTAADGCDAIIHLAAVPHPHVSNPEDILHTNVVGTGFLLEAAEKFGIKRFALASTCCAFGFYFATKPFDPDYLPLDEAHIAKPHDLYGLSKIMCEEACAAYTVRCGLTAVALRLTTVINLSRDGRHRNWAKHTLTDTERKQRDFWTYIELSDCARAFRLAIENAPEGTFAPLIIAARDPYSAHPMPEQIARHYPALSPFVENLPPHASLYDTRRAEEHIGFVAKNSWRDDPELASVAIK